MKVLFYAITILCLVQTITSTSLPKDLDPNDRFIYRRGAKCEPWNSYTDMEATFNKLTQGVCAFSPPLTCVQYKGLYAPVESGPVNLSIKLSVDKLLSLTTLKPQHSDSRFGTDKPYFLLVELVIKEDTMVKDTKRHIWMIDATKNTECSINTGYTNKDVEEVKVWMSNM